MHELSLTQNLVAIAEQHARREGAVRIRTLTLQIGVLSGVIPEAVEFAFETCSRGTMAENARLEIVAVPGLGYCPECEQDYPMADLTTTCPRCSGFTLDIRRGQEMALIEMEVD